MDSKSQPHVQVRKTAVKAAHRYGVVETPRQLGLAGTHFHVVGAGGVGMSGLARLMMSNGCRVTGSDQADSAVIETLRKCGAEISIGHSADNLAAPPDAVVLSAAITEDNPESRQAVKHGCKVYKYAQMLGELMDCYEGVAVSGTHGKSTTSGWLTQLLTAAEIDVNYIVGADISQLDASSGTGDSPYFIAEACEYDRSFLNLRPAIACILNVEQDHLDYYADENEIVEAFTEFALGVRPGGTVIAYGQDDNVARVLDALPPNVLRETFGFDRSCNFRADNLRLSQGLYNFEVYHNDKFLGSTRISLPGKHNVLNALAVIAVAVNIGLDPATVLELLDGFTGVDRRLMVKAEINGTIILDDYAHHPTEVRASLAAIRQRYTPNRLWCIFQPHQYSRTRFLLDDFAESFKLADITIVPEIYFVRDSAESREMVNASMLVEKVRENGSQALFIETFDDICQYLTENVEPGDLVVTMGAGDVWKVADEYIHWLGRNS